MYWAQYHILADPMFVLSWSFMVNDDGKITDMTRTTMMMVIMVMIMKMMIPWGVSVMAFCLHNVLSAVLSSVHP